MSRLFTFLYGFAMLACPMVMLKYQLAYQIPFVDEGYDLFEQIAVGGMYSLFYVALPLYGVMYLNRAINWHKPKS